MQKAQADDGTSDPPRTFCVLAIGDEAGFRDALQSVASEDDRIELINARDAREALSEDVVPKCDLVVVDSRVTVEPALEYFREASAAGFVTPTILLTDIGMTDLHTEFEVVTDLGRIRDALERAVARRGLEHTLAESEKMYRDIFEGSGDAIFIHRPGGKFFAVNREACRCLGYTREELLTMGPEDIDDKTSAMRVNERTSAALKGGAQRFEAIQVRKDGSCFPVEVNLRTFDYMDGPAIIATLRDMTERKRAEETIIRAKDKLGLLGAITRHDISNKLLTIYGYLEAMDGTVDDATRKKYLSRAKDAATVIAEQLRFAGDYQKAGTKEPVWTDVGTAVEAAASGFEVQRIVIHPGLKGLEVLADPMVDKVFWNLIDNAVRHGDGVTRIEFSAHPRGNSMVIVVEDDGGGITEKDKERIFEAGYGRNTGMGLFLVREILGITGMTITETGDTDRGARFELSVPEGKFRTAGQQS
ncbi:MAG: PAS domain S-box protein [Thermoplasmata archaeon]|jgi:PAS domain S-box-containing protein|nr:PAS domain S-box protein [Thermoplasmata archaeon]